MAPPVQTLLKQLSSAAHFKWVAKKDADDNTYSFVERPNSTCSAFSWGKVNASARSWVFRFMDEDEGNWRQFAPRLKKVSVTCPFFESVGEVQDIRFKMGPCTDNSIGDSSLRIWVNNFMEVRAYSTVGGFSVTATGEIYIDARPFFDSGGKFSCRTRNFDSHVNRRGMEVRETPMKRKRVASEDKPECERCVAKKRGLVGTELGSEDEPGRKRARKA